MLSRLVRNDCLLIKKCLSLLETRTGSREVHPNHMCSVRIPGSLCNAVMADKDIRIQSINLLEGSRLFVSTRDSMRLQRKTRSLVPFFRPV
jgi:hypothetical protein